jgi:hypothetical protein
MTRMEHGSTSKLGAVIAGCVLLVALLGGCTSARSSLGTSDSSCFLALPTASQAVHHQGELLGLHRFTVGSLRKKAPKLLLELDTSEKSSQLVCVVAFRGEFHSSAVTGPKGRPEGKLAVVVTTTPANHVLGTVIFRRIPLRFSHSHVG